MTWEKNSIIHRKYQRHCQKLPGLSDELVEVAVYTINAQTSAAFAYTNNEQ